MNQIQRHVLQCQSGPYRLNADLWVPPREGLAPVAVLCHGFTNNREECPLIKESAEGLLADGIAVVRFDHRGSGGSEGSFRDKTVSGLVEDLDAVVAATAATGMVDASRIGLWGRSFGASLVLMAMTRMDAAACFAAAPVLIFAQFFTPFWRKDLPFSPIPERLTRGVVKGPSELSTAFFEELSHFDAAMWDLRGLSGVLMAHGRQDAQVPFDLSVRFFDQLAEPKEFLDCKETGHQFIGYEETVVKALRNWFVGRFRD